MLCIMVAVGSYWAKNRGVHPNHGSGHFVCTFQDLQISGGQKG